MSKELWIYPDPLDASCSLLADNQTNIIGVRGTSPAGRQGVVFVIPDNVPNGNGATLTITATGKTPIKQRGIPAWGELVPLTPKGEAVFWSDDFRLLDSFKRQPPTRMEVLGIKTPFLGGIVVESPSYGKMPLWPAALSLLDYQTRKIWYKVMRDEGWTHQVIHIPNPGPSGGGGRNFYDNPMFPKPDWTNGMTVLDSRFTNLVYEVISEGFNVVISMDERYEYSIHIIRMVMSILDSYAIKFCITQPGYDGIFYDDGEVSKGWEPHTVKIPEWATIAREYYPDCYLAFQHQKGKIPLGQGPGDYRIGGLMDGYDTILSMYPSLVNRPQAGTQDANQTWQVAGRLLGTSYVRPWEQQPDDDPNPPFYLFDSPRGPRVDIAYETDDYPYRWVQTDMNNDAAIKSNQNDIIRTRGYMKSIGYNFTG